MNRNRTQHNSHLYSYSPSQNLEIESIEKKQWVWIHVWVGMGMKRKREPNIKQKVKCNLCRSDLLCLQYLSYLFLHVRKTRYEKIEKNKKKTELETAIAAIIQAHWTSDFFSRLFSNLVGQLFFQFLWFQPAHVNNRINTSENSILIASLKLLIKYLSACARLKLVFCSQCAKFQKLLMLNAQNLHSPHKTDFYVLHYIIYIPNNKIFLVYKV